MKPNTDFVIAWIDRMSAQFGGEVQDTETGRSTDWGKALCREVYGRDWPDDAAFRADDELPDIPDAVVEAARRWEAGAWPAWAEKTEVPHVS